jgi:hypothetical protein
MTERLSASTPAALYPQKDFLVLIFVRGSVNPRAIVFWKNYVNLKEKIQ